MGSPTNPAWAPFTLYPRPFMEVSPPPNGLRKMPVVQGVSARNVANLASSGRISVPATNQRLPFRKLVTVVGMMQEGFKPPQLALVALSRNPAPRRLPAVSASVE